VSPPPIRIASFKYKPSFKKDIKRLDRRILDDLEKALKELENDSVLPGRQLKKLTDSNKVYSMRIGKDYRLSFQLDNQTCILRRIGPRQKFYDNY
jgi:mRNA-degrading endonuclease RelE of RelBE toxin-antitoxin system